MPGLERLLRNLYGSTPQIDLDKKVARSNVQNPMTLDFPKLFDGMKRANVDLLGISFLASAEIRGDMAVILPTHQEFVLAGPHADAPAARRMFRVLDFREPAKMRAEMVRVEMAR